MSQTAVVANTTLVGLMALGGLGAIAGGAGNVTGAIRVTVWGAPVMAATVLVGMVVDFHPELSRLGG